VSIIPKATGLGLKATVGNTGGVIAFSGVVSGTTIAGVKIMGYRLFQIQNKVMSMELPVERQVLGGEHRTKISERTII